jgi:hypothetical protein
LVYRFVVSNAAIAIVDPIVDIWTREDCRIGCGQSQDRAFSKGCSEVSAVLAGMIHAAGTAASAANVPSATYCLSLGALAFVAEDEKGRKLRISRVSGIFCWALGSIMITGKRVMHAR